MLLLTAGSLLLVAIILGSMLGTIAVTLVTVFIVYILEGEGDGGSVDGTSAGVFLGVEIRQDGSS